MPRVSDLDLTGKSQAPLLEPPAPAPVPTAADGQRSAGFCRDLFTLARNDIQDYCSELWSLLRCGSGKVDAAVLASIAEAVDGHDIAMYTKTGCPYCQRASALLQKQQDGCSTQPGFSVFSSPGTEPGIRAALAHSLSVASVTFPVVFIGGIFAGGADELAELVELGEFNRLLQATRAESFRAGAYLCRSRASSVVCWRFILQSNLQVRTAYAHTMALTVVGILCVHC